MNDKESLDYSQAGVDIDAGNRWIKDVHKLAGNTPQHGVLSGVGGFGAQFALPTGMKEPVLISATDGVGTKLKLALLAEQHYGMGIDLVAMCANDIITSGAKPLYFLDYFATDHLNAAVAKEILSGISAACTECDMPLIGGETAEMPGCYPKDHYDLAGFCVGLIERQNIIDGSNVHINDQIIAIGSSGVHANGFSLVRHILERKKIDPLQQQLDGTALIDLLLQPTKLYVMPILKLLKQHQIKAIAHITGGGIPENLPRVLPNEVCAHIHNPGQTPAIFEFLQQQGNIALDEMRRTFNMGVGMLLVVSQDELDATLADLHGLGEQAWHAGHIEPKDDQRSVTYV